MAGDSGHIGRSHLWAIHRRIVRSVCQLLADLHMGQVFRYTDAAGIINAAGNVPIPDETPVRLHITAYVQGLEARHPSLAPIGIHSVQTKTDVEKVLHHEQDLKNRGTSALLAIVFPYAAFAGPLDLAHSTRDAGQTAPNIIVTVDDSASAGT